MRQFAADFTESLRIAAEQLAAHKLRSLLTALGVIIGVWAVVMIGLALQGIENGFRASLEMLGSDVLYVERMPWRDVGDDWRRYRSRPNLEDRDAGKLNAIFWAEADMPLEIAAPTVWWATPISRGEREVERPDLFGTTSDFLQIMTGEVAHGRFFTVAEALAGQNVIMLGHDLAEALFPEGSEQAVGENVRLANRRYTVIGVMAAQGSFLGLQSFDRQAYIPLRSMRKFFRGYRWWDTTAIRVRIRDGVSVEDARSELIGAMRRVRGLGPGEENNFEVNHSSALDDTFGPVFSGLAIGGLFITGLALLVGAIGIMNITFVSVKERTREIGTRRALGGRRRSILMQFLAEAASVSLLGGLVGLLMAGGTKLALNVAVPQFPAAFSIPLIVLAVVLSVATGVVSGFLPALQAAKLDPAEALRHE